MFLLVDAFMFFAHCHVVLTIIFNVTVVLSIAYYVFPFATGATGCSYPLKPEAEFAEDL